MWAISLHLAIKILKSVVEIEFDTKNARHFLKKLFRDAHKLTRSTGVTVTFVIMYMTKEEFNTIFAEILDENGIARDMVLTPAVMEKLMSYLLHIRMLDDKWDMEVHCPPEDEEPETAGSSSSANVPVHKDPEDLYVEHEDDLSGVDPDTQQKFNKLLSVLLTHARERRKSDPLLPLVKKRKVASTTKEAVKQVITSFLQ